MGIVRSRCEAAAPVRRAAAAVCATWLAATLALAFAAVPAQAQERSRALSLASAQEVEKLSAKQYEDLKREAAAQRALAPPDYPPLQRLRAIAQRLIAQAPRYNERARQWSWEVNLIGSKQVNAFCMPGGKIAFFTGIIDRLKLGDDEIAQVMGHEMAHALLEHGRERVGKARAAQWVTLGASVFSQILGYGDLGGTLASGGSQLLLLKYGREDELEADALGMELAARAGFDPRAATVLWQKMSRLQQQGGGTPQWLSTHPSNSVRLRDIERRLPKAMELYAAATGRSPDAVPPYRTAAIAAPGQTPSTPGQPQPRPAR